MKKFISNKLIKVNLFCVAILFTWVINREAFLNPLPSLHFIKTSELEEVNFAFISDYGSNTSNEATVASLVKSWSPDFVLTGGDNNYPHGEAATIDPNIGKYYSEFIYPYTGSFGAGATANKFYPCLGNHDWEVAGAVPYLQYFSLPGNERYYDFIKGNSHFFVIDSDPHEPDGTSYSSVQANWLKNKLQSSSAKWKVVCFHHSPYASDTVNGSQAWMRWPFKTWGADVVLSGHSHVYERIIKEGFPYFVNGLGGSGKYQFKTTPVSGSLFRYNSNFGAMKITVKPDTMYFKFYNINNQLIDSYKIVKSSETVNCFAGITPGSSTTFCAGGSVEFFSTTGAGYSYQWIKNGTKINGATSPQYTATSAGDYQVKVTSGSCSDWSSPVRVRINTSLEARITPGGPLTFCRGGSVTLYANTCNGYTYQWKKNGYVISGANSSYYLASTTGNYQVKIMNGSSVAWSSQTTVNVTSCSQKLIQANEAVNTALKEADDPNSLLYPNPNQGVFYYRLNYEVEVKDAEEVAEVFNLSGQIIYKKIFRRDDEERNIELDTNVPDGIYFLRVQKEGQVFKRQFILDR